MLQFRQFDGSSQKTIGRDGGERDRRRDRGDGEETGVQRGSGQFQKPAGYVRVKQHQGGMVSRDTQGFTVNPWVGVSHKLVNPWVGVGHKPVKT